MVCTLALLGIELHPLNWAPIRAGSCQRRGRLSLCPARFASVGWLPCYARLCCLFAFSKQRGGQGHLKRKVVVALTKSIFFGIISNTLLRRNIMRQFYLLAVPQCNTTLNFYFSLSDDFLNSLNLAFYLSTFL